MSRLSIVIPHLGSVKDLEDSLVSVLENRPADCQVIVVLNDLYTDPYDLEDEVCFVYATHGADLATCLNLGLDVAEAKIVHFLAPGIQVSPHWTEEVLPHFDDPEVGVVAPLVLALDEPDRVVTAGLAYQAGGMVQWLGRGASPASIGRQEKGVLGPDATAGFYRKINEVPTALMILIVIMVIVKPF